MNRLLIIVIVSVVLGSCVGQQKSTNKGNREQDIAQRITAGEQPEKIGQGRVYEVMELTFDGPQQRSMDTPARDIDFRVRFRHESGAPEYTVYGFWDGDGKGGMTGDVFKVRFTPTKAGRWNLAEVASNADELEGQREGDYVTAVPSDHPGFWIVDEDSPGRRWYRRPDGSHPYIFGNTHYSFLSGYGPGGQPGGNGIVADITGNAAYFKKLRFSLHGDRYPHPTEKPFFDDEGEPTDRGDYSHRPNPAWFHERVDLAVQTAYVHDLIADLILAGPDTEESRSTLRARYNNGDPTPYLKYVVARYGSYPNVWITLANEYEGWNPTYSEKEIARFGRIIRQFLPYPTPLSVHSSPRTLWSAAFDTLPAWADHIVIQQKLRHLAPAADVIREARGKPGGGVREMPLVNDELSYQGAGDKHNEGDTIEAHLGAFLGGGYATTGYKTGSKTGHYFAGGFDPDEHTAADNLRWLRRQIDAHITFWEMEPDLGIFSNLGEDFRGMARTGQEFVLGTNEAREVIIANLSPGAWQVVRYDVMAKQAETLSTDAAGRFTFDAPDSRAVLFHFKKQ